MSTVTDMRAIAEECRRMGLKVAAIPGWETRGLGPLTPEYVTCHHVAAERDVTKLLLDGRPGIRGPLCNWELRKDGTVVLVAARRANHAGVGVVPSSRSYGIEATGPVPITAQGAKAYPNYQAYIQLVAAIRKHHGWGSDRVVAHKETARPLGRKVDPMFDMSVFRAQVSMQLTRSAPAAATATALMEDDMPYDEIEMVNLAKRGVNAAGTIHGQRDLAGSLQVIVDRVTRLEQAITELKAALYAPAPETPETPQS